MPSQLSQHVTKLRRLMSPTEQRKLFRELGEMVVNEAQRAFDKKRSPDGRKWKPQARNYGNPLMQKTDALKQSINYGAIRINHDGFSIRTDIPYARFHQNGAKKPGSTWRLPARPMFLTQLNTPGAKIKMTKIVTDHVKRVMKCAGLPTWWTASMISWTIPRCLKS